MMAAEEASWLACTCDSDIYACPAHPNAGVELAAREADERARALLGERTPQVTETPTTGHAMEYLLLAAIVVGSLFAAFFIGAAAVNILTR